MTRTALLKKNWIWRIFDLSYGCAQTCLCPNLDVKTPPLNLFKYQIEVLQRKGCSGVGRICPLPHQGGNPGAHSGSRHLLPGLQQTPHRQAPQRSRRLLAIWCWAEPSFPAPLRFSSHYAGSLLQFRPSARLELPLKPNTPAQLLHLWMIGQPVTPRDLWSLSFFWEAESPPFQTVRLTKHVVTFSKKKTKKKSLQVFVLRASKKALVYSDGMYWDVLYLALLMHLLKVTLDKSACKMNLMWCKKTLQSGIIYWQLLSWNSRQKKVQCLN